MSIDGLDYSTFFCVDDIILFAAGSVREASYIKRDLNLFGHGS